jgi:hypothetical protein
MPAEEDNLTLRFLRETRDVQAATDAKAEAVSAKFDATSAKLDKLTVEVIGVKGPLGKVEEGMEAIAGVLSREMELLK